MTKTYITTSIPYVNGAPHIGFALEIVQADTIARYHRLVNDETYFLTGTDENAQKNVESAEKQGSPIQDFVNKNAKKFLSLKELLNLTFDDFIRTSSDRHKTGAQEFWKKCEKDIFKKTYSGLYCIGCETFYKDGEFENNICPDHNRELELVEEENYFFRLSRYSEDIKNLIENDVVKVSPIEKKHEVLQFVEKGLDDISISRPAERLRGWGVPIPGDESHRMYVWFDALTNYLTALGSENEKLYTDFWIKSKNKVHLVGKDIIKFHAIYWIGMLLSAKIPLPTNILVHGFIESEGKKMSKTLGNVVDPFAEVETYGTDPVRYYLLREIPTFSDGDYSRTRMEQLYSADLANELGNTLSRVCALAAKDGIKIEHPQNSLDLEFSHFMNGYRLSEALALLWEKFIRPMNKVINEVEPWNLSPQGRRQHLKIWLEKLHSVGYHLQPFLPETANKILAATSGTIEKASPLFPRK